jgi:hypothetical protein
MLMKFGEHKGRDLKRVPARYLIWLYETAKEDRALGSVVVQELNRRREQGDRSVDLAMCEVEVELRHLTERFALQVGDGYRLSRVLGFVNARVGNIGFDRLMSKLAGVSDNGDTLTVSWKSQPTKAEQYCFEESWGDSLIGRQFGGVEHLLNDVVCPTPEY